MTRVSLLRHGATTAGNRYCGSTDTALSEQGWAQMWTAVAGRRWDRILSSPLRRCADFAARLGGNLAVPCGVDPRLREMHFGEWEGCSAAELMERAPDALSRFWKNPLEHPPPAAEPLPQLRARVSQLWRELADAGGDQSLLLVTHGGPIRVLLAERAAKPLSGLLDIEVGHAQLFDLTASQVTYTA